MLDAIRERFHREKLHFDALGDVVKHLLYSYILYLISYPIIGLFINAYFWRQTEDITLIAAYNLGFFIALPIGFYINGLLLRRFHILKLYWIGTVLQGVAAFLAIFAPTLSFDRVLVYGLIYGIGGGLYWANKNYITLKITKGRNRLYYNNLESSIDLIVNIVMPVLIGWFIVLGAKIDFYTADSAYKILIFIVLILLTVSGYILQSADIYSKKIDKIVVTRPSKYWNLNRLAQFLYWILSGINAFIPSILVLMFVGEEGILGTIESVTAGVVAVVLYIVGRKTKEEHALKIILATGSVFLLGTIIYNFTYGFIGALIYTVFWSLTSSIFYNALYTNTMSVMDIEVEENENVTQYSLVFDNELFFNLGRVFGMILFFGVAYLYSQEISLRFTPVIAAVLQLLIVFPLAKLMKHVAAKDQS